MFGIDLATKRVTTYRAMPGEYNEVEGIFPDGNDTLVESSRDQSQHDSNHIDLWKLRLEPNSTDFVADDPLGRLRRLQGEQPRGES